MAKRKNRSLRFLRFVLTNLSWDAIKFILSAISSPAVKYRLDVFGIANKYGDPIAYITYFAISYGLFSILGDLWELAFGEEKKLVRLGELRTEGVKLRNRCTKLKTVEELEDWIEKYKAWDAKLISAVKALSKSKSAWIRTLNQMPFISLRQPINQDHLRYIRVVNEKLVRLEKIMAQYDIPRG